MPELIDRQAVLAEIVEFQIRFNETGDSHERVAYATAEHCMLVIKAAPTIKAEPVRHARWINNTFCSNCKRFPVDVSVPISNQELTKYFSWCPHCGARMDDEPDSWHTGSDFCGNCTHVNKCRAEDGIYACELSGEIIDPDDSSCSMFEHPFDLTKKEFTGKPDREECRHCPKSQCDNCMNFPF